MDDKVYERATQIKFDISELEKEIKKVESMLDKITYGHVKTTQFVDNISPALKVPPTFFKSCLVKYRQECLQIKGALEIAFKLL